MKIAKAHYKPKKPIVPHSPGGPARALDSQRNSARSVMAEAILNAMGKGEFVAHSAGVRPATRVDPVAVELLERARISTVGLHPRHVDEFARENAPGPFSASARSPNDRYWVILALRNTKPSANRPPTHSVEPF